MDAPCRRLLPVPRRRRPPVPAAVPAPEAVSEHAVFVLSTVYVLDADAATLVRTVPARARPSTEPMMAQRRAVALTVALRRVTEPMRK